MSEVTYYFNAYSDEWEFNPGFMVDNILTNFASADTVNDLEILTGNSCLGTDLGTITKVEVRFYGYGDGNDYIEIHTIFDGATGASHVLAAFGTEAGWSNYIEITNDGNAPSPWTFSDVPKVDLKVYKKTSAKGNLLYCAKAEIQVTYTPTAEGVTRSYGYIF